MTVIETERGRLRAWRDDDAPAFAAMHADPEVMWDAVAPLTRVDADAKLARYRRTFEDWGFSRLAMVNADDQFLGYVGVLPIADGHPLAPGVEIGWRFRREVWGCGYATEGARAVLADVLQRFGFREVLSFTAPDNLRSQAVMVRIGLVRAAERDFVAADGWRGWVWTTSR